MPRYHFNVHDGEEFRDVEGMELADLMAARVVAVRCSGDFIRDHAEAFWSGDEWKMDVTDDRGMILFTLTFFASDASCINGGIN